ncbi:hypothetical protein [Sulfurimonas sp. HSL-1716]|uniref:hypothetical protein n=1 Tax=Hydrocurvibacter sulfurireducens TaxID=3131937 RepID=UPI0031F9853E
MYRKYLVLALSFSALLLTGCAAGAKIAIPSYSPPREEAKIKKMITKDDKIPEGAYIAIAINPDVLNIKRALPKMRDYLIDNIKTKLTQTNFIALNPIAGENDVVLIMSVENYQYNTTAHKRSLELEINFTLSRGAEEFLSKSYKTSKNRQSKDVIRLPSEAELASEAAKDVVEDFVADISPLKTFQLREFKALPDDISYAIDYAKRRNYSGAIKAMESYKGGRDMNFYYDLAILYEAQASVSENLQGLEKADEYYNMALSKGGSKDTLVISAKARFDNFYELLKKTKAQDAKNQGLIKNRNGELGRSADEFE